MALAFERLVGRIMVVFGSRKAFAAAMGLSQLTLGRKLSGENDWKSSEIIKACSLLGIDLNDIGHYFFAARV